MVPAVSAGPSFFTKRLFGINKQEGNVFRNFIQKGLGYSLITSMSFVVILTFNNEISAEVGLYPKKWTRG